MAVTDSGSKEKVVVIGGGMGGLAVALQVRAKGRDVVLIEKNTHLGGIAAGFEDNGIRGFYPLAFGDYSLFEALFEPFDRKVEDYVEIIHQQNMITRFIYNNKDSLELGDLNYSLDKMKQISTEHATQYQQLYDLSRQFHQLLEEITANATGPSFLSKLKLVGSIIKALPFLPYLNKSFAQLVEKYVKDESVQMAINYRTSLLGENPYTTSGIYIMMLHMQELWGSFTAPGGIAGLVEALEKLMLDVGIEVIKGDAVTSLDCKEGSVNMAVLQSGKQIRCSHVISNISPYHLYGSLLPEKYGVEARQLLEKVKFTPSLFSYHFTTKQNYSDLPSMMIVFPGDFKKFCSQLYDNKAAPEEMLLGVYRSTFYDSTFSSPGTDHFSVYLTSPNLQADICWQEEMCEQLIEDIVARLEEYLLPDLSENIIDGFYLTPQDAQSRCSLPYGSTFGPQVTTVYRGKQLFAHTEPDLDNLYLVGHNTLPGPGLNAAVMSAQLVADKITVD